MGFIFYIKVGSHAYIFKEIMETQKIVERLQQVHKAHNKERKQGGWGVPNPSNIEDTIYGVAADKILNQEADIKRLVIALKSQHQPHMDFCHELDMNVADLLKEFILK
jgi:hypothetical protein